MEGCVSHEPNDEGSLQAPTGVLEGSAVFGRVERGGKVCFPFSLVLFLVSRARWLSCILASC